MDIEEEECCGSGCNNCVLDSKIKKNQSELPENYINIFNGNYGKFSVESIKDVATGVYLINFRWKSEGTTENLILKIPPGWYLQLRIKASSIRKDKNVIFKDFNTFEDPEDFLAKLEGQAKHDKDTSKEYLSRPYTPINTDARNLSFDVLFKLEKFGKMSQLIAKLKVGDEIEFKGPYGELVYQRNTFRNLYLFSHGVAVAPLYSLISSIVSDESDETFIHLIACYQNINEILLRDEVQNLRQFWNFNASIYLAHETTDIEGQVKFRENIYRKRLQHDDVDKIIQFRDKTSYFLICGTEKFTGALCTTLTRLGIDQDNIFVFK